ncbi:MAG: MFS transporter, partial [Asticcacaulis sp.]
GNLIVPMFVMGAAMSTFFTSMITVSFRDVAPHQMPAASGLSNFARITAGSFAASLATTLWDNYETHAQGNIASAMSGHSGGGGGVEQAVHQLMQMGMSQAQAVAAITRQVTQQAYLLATVDIFRISSIIIVCLIPLIWLSRRAMANGAVHAAD